MATRRKTITRTTINFWLDAILLTLFLTLCWASVIVHFIFPPGPDARGWLLWNWSYRQWSDFQFGVLAALSLAVLVHLMLHWTWIMGVIMTHYAPRRNGKAKQRDDGSWTLYGVGTLIVVFNILGIGIAAAALMIQGPTP